MQLILLDSDENYLKALGIVVSSQMKENIELFTYSNELDLLKDSHLFNLDPYLLIHESFINQLNNNHHMIDLCCKLNIAILSEGIIDSGPIDIWLQSVVKNYCTKDMNTYIHMKHQRIDKLFDNIKDRYLNHTNIQLYTGSSQTQFVSIFCPYGTLESSSNLETTLQKFPSQHNILLIHYDPYYYVNNQTKFNLSYLFTLIKRGKENLSIIINELKQQHTHNIDVLAGPLNMLDIDCLTDEECQGYLYSLSHHLKYDYIVFNFNGLHLTKHITNILNQSKDCILCSQDEDVQLSVIRQADITWTLMTNQLKLILKEVII